MNAPRQPLHHLGQLFQGLTLNRYANQHGQEILMLNPPQLTGLQTNTDQAELVRIDLDDKTKNHRLRPNDTLITIRNKPLKASVMLRPPNQHHAVAGQNLAVFRPNPTRIYPLYLAGLLRSQHGQTLLEPYFSQSSTVPLISLTALRSFELPLPPLETQRTLAHLMLAAERANHADLERIQQRREVIESTLSQTLGER